MRRVPIRYGPRAGWAYLRELRGSDEEAVDGTDTDVAIALLDRLLLSVPGAALGPGDAATLCAADRDRLLAAVHLRSIGSRIASSPTCGGCGARFDLEFDLATMVAELDAGAAPWRRPDGTYETPGGLRFRLPTGADELAAAGSADAERRIAEGCVLAGEADPATVGGAMESVAPLVDVELAATCPACGREQPLRFDIQSYLLARLLSEHATRAREIHALAVAYRWGLDEILALPRARRATFLDFLERQAGR
jgi:hypothetical protein